MSVRTVRYEVAAIMELLHVTSRFAAGVAYHDVYQDYGRPPDVAHP